MELLDQQRVLLQSTVKINIDEVKNVEAKFTKLYWRYENGKRDFYLTGKQTVQDGNQNWEFIITAEVRKI